MARNFRQRKTECVCKQKIEKKWKKTESSRKREREREDKSEKMDDFLSA